MNIPIWWKKNCRMQLTNWPKMLFFLKNLLLAKWKKGILLRETSTPGSNLFYYTDTASKKPLHQQSPQKKCYRFPKIILLKRYHLVVVEWPVPLVTKKNIIS